MLMTLLQAEAAVEKFTADSIQARTSETLAALKDTEPNVLLQNLGQQALHFGLKVLAALAIYIIGAWIIKKIVKIVAKGFEKKRSDAALASFVKSLVSITLWVLLIIITVGALGINTTSLAALLAAGSDASRQSPFSQDAIEITVNKQIASFFIPIKCAGMYVNNIQQFT